MDSSLWLNMDKEAKGKLPKGSDIDMKDSEGNCSQQRLDNMHMWTGVSI